MAGCRESYGKNDKEVTREVTSEVTRKDIEKLKEAL